MILATIVLAGSGSPDGVHLGEGHPFRLLPGWLLNPGLPSAMPSAVLQYAQKFCDESPALFSSAFESSLVVGVLRLCPPYSVMPLEEETIFLFIASVASVTKEASNKGRGSAVIRERWKSILISLLSPSFL